MRFKEFFQDDVDDEQNLSEGYAKKGFAYEKLIVNKLKKHGLMSKQAKAAGSSGSAADGHMVVGGYKHDIEIKKDRGAMMGQIELHHHPERGWHISDRSRTNYPKTAEHLDKSGFLKDVNKQWGKPSGNYERDLKMGNVYKHVEGTDAIAAHYHNDRSTPYMHIGGHGLFHLKKDSAGIGTSRLTGNTQFRARFKARKKDKVTGKRSYGALVVMSLREPNSSKVSLDSDEHIKNIAREVK